jgi:hypothetical protein
MATSAAALILTSLDSADGGDTTAVDRGAAGNRGAAVAPEATTSRSCRRPYGRFRAGRWPPACWRPYAATSPFNRRVPRRPPLLSNSEAIVSRLAGWGAPQNLVVGHSRGDSDYFHPIYWSRRRDPLFRVNCVSYGRCSVEGHRVRIPDEARPASGGDGHLAVMDQRTGWEYDFWEVRSKPRGGGRLVVSHGGRTRIKGSGLGSNATAAWFGLAAGVIRAAEIRAGRINHALFMHVRCTAGPSVYPAHKGATGARCSDLGLDARDAPPLGARLWLDLDSRAIDRLDLPRWKTAVLKAMNRYGMIVGDTGGGAAWGIQAESGATYTSFGVPDPWERIAAAADAARYGDGYVLPLANRVDWRRHLHVLDPCVSRGGC